MAKYSSDLLDFIVLTTKDQLQTLSQIRHFNNLKVAFKADQIWIKGFSLDQINSVEVKTLPFKSIFYIKDNLLFPKGSLLPQTKLPNMLLWSPIQNAFLIEAPKINHNFFGIHDTVSPKIVPFKEEKDSVALLTKITSSTKQTIERTAAHRFKNLAYTIINTNSLLIIGTPVLPLQGDSYWMDNNFLFPNGYYIEYPIMSPCITSKVDPTNSHYVLWDKKSDYTLIAKSNLKPLSISSLRLSI